MCWARISCIQNFNPTRPVVLIKCVLYIQSYQSYKSYLWKHLPDWLLRNLERATLVVLELITSHLVFGIACSTGYLRIWKKQLLSFWNYHHHRSTDMSMKSSLLFRTDLLQKWFIRVHWIGPLIQPRGFLIQSGVHFKTAIDRSSPSLFERSYSPSPIPFHFFCHAMKWNYGLTLGRF